MEVRFRGFFPCYSFAGLPPAAIVGTRLSNAQGTSVFRACLADTEGDT